MIFDQCPQVICISCPGWRKLGQCQVRSCCYHGCSESVYACPGVDVIPSQGCEDAVRQLPESYHDAAERKASCVLLPCDVAISLKLPFAKNGILSSLRVSAIFLTFINGGRRGCVSCGQRVIVGKGEQLRNLGNTTPIINLFRVTIRNNWTIEGLASGQNCGFVSECDMFWICSFVVIPNCKVYMASCF